MTYYTKHKKIILAKAKSGYVGFNRLRIIKTSRRIIDGYKRKTLCGVKNRPRYNDKEIEIIKDNFYKMKIVELAIMLGRPFAGLQEKCTTLGLRKKQLTK